MELKEFITQTLVQITEGVADAQKLVKQSGCLITRSAAVLLLRFNRSLPQIKEDILVF